MIQIPIFIIIAAVVLVLLLMALIYMLGHLAGSIKWGSERIKDYNDAKKALESAMADRKEAVECREEALKSAERLEELKGQIDLYQYNINFYIEILKSKRTKEVLEVLKCYPAITGSFDEGTMEVLASDIVEGLFNAYQKECEQDKEKEKK